MSKCSKVYEESISRQGRNVDGLRQIVQECKDKDISIYFIKEGFNTGNSNNMFKFILTILDAGAEMERELIMVWIREDMVKAKRYSIRSGCLVVRPLQDIPACLKKYFPHVKRCGHYSHELCPADWNQQADAL